jgi:quinone-modifying oxidoreductase subunit QmoC
MEYANLFPHWLLISFFTFFWGLSVFLGLVGVSRFWMAMKKTDSEAGITVRAKGLLPSAIQVFKDILFHSRFAKCKTLASRRSAHLYAFYGFLALFLVSAWAVVLLYMINPLVDDPLLYPFPFLNPAKIFANLGALALVLGCALAIRERLKNDTAAGQSTEFDWIFLLILLIVGITGVFVEALRYAQLQAVGYAVYFVHLIFAFMLLVYLPYSKFAHLIYRTVALIYVEYSGRNQSRTEVPVEGKAAGKAA